MPSLMLINPLKSEKLNEYKAFVTEFSEQRKEKYRDMLKRFGLTSSTVHYHRIADQEFVIVIHEQQAWKEALLANWKNSTHPFDLWFKAQSTKFYDFQ